MINNEFHIIGIATSEFEDIGNGKFVSYLLKVEVEKLGSKTGNNFELSIQVYGTNKAIDPTSSILGHQVAINGYLDSYSTKDGSIITKLVGQNIYVLDKNSTSDKKIHPETSCNLQTNKKPSADEWEKMKNDITQQDIEDGDELPF